MNMLAINWNRLANKDDGSCVLSGAVVTVNETQSIAATSSVAVTSTSSTNIDMSLERHVELTVPSTNATTSVSEATGQVLGASTQTFTRKLRIGSRGNDVTLLQERLTDLGFYFGPITGYFGRLTSSAVRVFQASHGLESVGAVGPLTLAALNQGSAVSATLATISMEGKLLSSMP
jgi:peptidoglycan hydrolase-like protein with peptidoglycan-binding domain